jgi:tripartite-type tricarboxylate transporter receptor subunit TctC
MLFERSTKTAPFRFALAVLLLTAFSPDPASALYPDRIIRIVVPFAPGGGTDVIARTLAQEMAKDLGATVIIENKPGAGTIIGTQAVATSEPDGYTLLMGTFANAVNPSLNAKLPYDPHKDFAPVALIARSFNIVVVNPKSPFQSIADLIAAAKADPDKLSYGTFGTGTSAHLAGELFKDMAKVNLTMVPYKGPRLRSPT